MEGEPRSTDALPQYNGAGEVYLVTGGEGFLGRHLVEALIRHRPAAEIRIFARKQSYFDDPPNVHYVFGDLVDRQSVHAACEGITTVFHVASLLTPNEDMLRRVNIDGTRYLLDAAREQQVRRMIFVGSSTAVLNRVPLENADETAPYTTNPPDPYMAIKAEAERLVMAWGKETGRLVCTLRPPLMFGHGDRHLAPVLMPLAKSVFSRWRLGDGSVTNVMYVENAAHALLLAEERLQPGSPVDGEVFNVHDGYVINLYELARVMAREIGLPHAEQLLRWRCPTLPVLAVAHMFDGIRVLMRPLVDWTPPLRVRDVLLVDLSHTFSAEKARKLLAYTPPISQSEGLARTRSWLRKLYDEA
ncbi:hypothetical protein SYNPS1DRAFT_23800 [Syncephalis pseudoplumigaleata]|uniref:Ketoreductase domain-containing protein n=1 Tax=Syncephalis pseudoplumigaleata TaxID=1712513 RepID=A0A4P9YVN6_9FUNG|nr:hypothetical protein SYNPS1DRAFT_23800 [Syncephalis pseudoplumigaleata]|eukprot:RKP24106.1 hypothetical protein SYNPS1DRAFT_23800 [Syncephalis pseudoplumigaleata]